jgi:hypothetical protein
MAGTQDFFAEKAVRQMLRAVAKGKREAIITGHGKALVALERLRRGTACGGKEDGGGTRWVPNGSKDGVSGEAWRKSGPKRHQRFLHSLAEIVAFSTAPRTLLKTSILQKNNRLARLADAQNPPLGETLCSQRLG